ncbi:MAG: hypothetical protein JW995_03145 [Melioribacteraceae bacterium]|nr:hypothetical protein [Melioribacteraceae bacterium]
MPVLKLNNLKLPKWSELTAIDIFNIQPDSVLNIERKGKKEILFICEGNVDLLFQGNKFKLQQSDITDVIENTGEYSIKTLLENTIVVRISGCWGDDCGTRGIFSIRNSDFPQNIGDMTDYEQERKTNFDNHYHDCDEYWVIYAGSGKIATEGTIYEIASGTCVATRAGEKHDIVDVYEEIKGVYFESTLIGKKRTGHLWDHSTINYRGLR